MAAIKKGAFRMHKQKLFLIALLFTVLTLSLMMAQSSRASTVAPIQSGATIPVEALLKTDGTLALPQGVSGTLDLAGWNVKLDLERGPVLTPMSPTSDTWQKVDNGVHLDVLALAVMNGQLYVGGYFDK